MIAAILRRIGPVWLGAMLAIAAVSAVSADSVYIRNPLWVGAQVYSDWSHGSGYGEAALDLIYANGGTTGGQGVYWRADNVTATEQVYYEVYGLRHKLHGRPL